MHVASKALQRVMLNTLPKVLIGNKTHTLHRKYLYHFIHHNIQSVQRKLYFCLLRIHIKEATQSTHALFKLYNTGNSNNKYIYSIEIFGQ